MHKCLAACFLSEQQTAISIWIIPGFSPMEEVFGYLAFWVGLWNFPFWLPLDCDCEILPGEPLAQSQLDLSIGTSNGSEDKLNQLFSPAYLPSLTAAIFLCTATEILLIKMNRSQGCSYPLLCQRLVITSASWFSSICQNLMTSASMTEQGWASCDKTGRI